MICLVNPNNRVPSPFSAVEPPLWLGLIAGDQIDKGQDVVIIDAEAESLTVEETVSRVNDLRPKETIIVVMGANPSVSSTPKMPVAKKLLRQMNARLTGIHPIALKYPNTIVKPFEGCPSVPWGLLPMDKYIAHNWHCLGRERKPYAVLYTSLNCPYSCLYCNVHTLYGDRKMRYRPVKDVFQELDYFAEQGIRNIKIWDELFCLNETRVDIICDYIVETEYDFNIWAYARVDTVNLGMLLKMKKAGINWLCYGFESTEEVKQQVNKKTTAQETQEAIEMTRNAGISIIANFIFGLPGDTLDNMKATLDMAIRENFEYVNFYVALPYPGSEWYESLKKKPIDWGSFSQFSPNICASPEVVKFRDEAFKTYFNRPEYLNMIEKKFGERKHIQEMLKWSIRKP